MNLPLIVKCVYRAAAVSAVVSFLTRLIGQSIPDTTVLPTAHIETALNATVLGLGSGAIWIYSDELVRWTLIVKRSLAAIGLRAGSFAYICWSGSGIVGESYYWFVHHPTKAELDSPFSFFHSSRDFLFGRITAILIAVVVTLWAPRIVRAAVGAIEEKRRLEEIE